MELKYLDLNQLLILEQQLNKILDIFYQSADYIWYQSVKDVQDKWHISSNLSRLQKAQNIKNCEDKLVATLYDIHREISLRSQVLQKVKNK